jgi:hypothetical protein
MKNFVKLLMVVLMIGFASCAGAGEDDVIKDIEGNILYSVESAKIKVGESVTLKLVTDTVETKAIYNAKTKTYTVKFCFTNKTYSHLEFSFPEDKDEKGYRFIKLLDWSRNTGYDYYNGKGYMERIEKMGNRKIEFSFKNINMRQNPNPGYGNNEVYEGDFTLIRK